MITDTYEELFRLDFSKFKELVLSQGIEIAEEQLLLIYNLIQNNRYALIDSHYNSVLYNYISEKTSISTCQKIRYFINNCPSYFRLGLKV